MTDRKGPAAAGGAPAADQHGSVRNVVLVGHSGAGKTTLVEALLVATGTIQRAGRVEDGTTVSDFDEVEIRQQRSVNLTLAPLIHAGIKVNLLDTPGYADFTGDLRAGLRAADAALFAVAATEGVDGLTRMLWEECAAVGTPRAVVITKIDHQRGDFEEALAACRAAFGDSVAPLYLPVSDGQGNVQGLVGLLHANWVMNPDRYSRLGSDVTIKPSSFSSVIKTRARSTRYSNSADVNRGTSRCRSFFMSTLPNYPHRPRRVFERSPAGGTDPDQVRHLTLFGGDMENGADRAAWNTMTFCPRRSRTRTMPATKPPTCAQNATPGSLGEAATALKSCVANHSAKRRIAGTLTSRTKMKIHMNRTTLARGRRMR